MSVMSYFLYSYSDFFLKTILTFSTWTVSWPWVMRPFKGLFNIGTYFNIQVKCEDAFPGSPFLASLISQSVESGPLFLPWFNWNQCPTSHQPFSENKQMGCSHFISKIRMVKVKSTLPKCECSTIVVPKAYYNNIETFHKQQWNKDIISNI